MCCGVVYRAVISLWALTSSCPLNLLEISDYILIRRCHWGVISYASLQRFSVYWGSIRRYLSKSARTTLVTCFVFARIDFRNVTFTDLPRCDPNRLQSIQNAAVHLTVGARQFDQVTPLLQSQHWLPIEQRITFKLSVMMYKTVNGIAPSYLQEYVIYPPSSIYSLRLQVSWQWPVVRT